MSEFSKTRRSFDRLRGLLLTGAIFNPPIRDSLHAACDRVPANAILMAVEAGGGKGEVENHVLVDGFEYTSSSAMPDLNFILALYSSPVRQPMVEVYPGLLEKLEVHKRDWRSRVRAFKIEQQAQKPIVTEGLPPLPPRNNLPIVGRLAIGSNKMPLSYRTHPVPLQDLAQYQANLVVEDTVLLQTILPPPLAFQTPERCAQTGPPIRVKPPDIHVDSEMLKELVDSLAKNGQVIIKNVAGPARQTMNTTLQINGLDHEWKSETTAGVPNENPVQVVTLRVYSRHNPFIDYQLAKGSSAGKTSALQDLIAQAVLDALTFRAGEVSIPAVSVEQVKPAVGKPLATVTNPFHLDMLRSSKAEYRPEELPQNAEALREDTRTDWNLDFDINELSKPIEQIMPEVIEMLKTTIKQYWTTRYELDRDKNPVLKISKTPEWKSQSTKPSKDSETKKKPPSRRRRYYGPRGRPVS